MIVQVFLTQSRLWRRLLCSPKITQKWGIGSESDGYVSNGDMALFASLSDSPLVGLVPSRVFLELQCLGDVRPPPPPFRPPTVRGRRQSWGTTGARGDGPMFPRIPIYGTAATPSFLVYVRYSLLADAKSLLFLLQYLRYLVFF